MLYHITNLTHSSKAFRSVNTGETVLIPPKSEGIYDLAPLARRDYAGLEITETTPVVSVAPAELSAEPPAPPADDPPPTPTPSVVETKPGKGKAAVDPGPAPWQQGIGNSVKD